MRGASYDEGGGEYRAVLGGRLPGEGDVEQPDQLDRDLLEWLADRGQPGGLRGRRVVDTARLQVRPRHIRIRLDDLEATARRIPGADF